MNKVKNRPIAVGMLGLALSIAALSLAERQAVSDQVAQAIWGGGCACTGSATCSATECSSACDSFSGGSYSVCQSAQGSGTCATHEVVCGTKSYCDGGEGGCDFGEKDCTCHSADNKVSGC